VRGITVLSLPWDTLNSVLVIQARMTYLSAGAATARHWLEQELIKLGSAVPAQVRESLEAELARIAIQSGNQAQALGYAAFVLDRPWGDHERSICPSQEIDGAGIAQARLMIAAGRLAEAIARLHTLLEHAQQSGRTWRAAKLGVLLAVALQRHGQPREAEAQLVRALQLGTHSGMVRLFLDEGSNVLDMLRQLQSRPRTSLSVAEANHLDALLRIASPAIPYPPAELKLTPVERKLLVLIAQGLSNREIATQLDISINTVKWHLAHIFQKIDVGNRGQAVFKARLAGLLD
jgi:LuxR family maltose regulon positive regulatory protein